MKQFIILLVLGASLSLNAQSENAFFNAFKNSDISSLDLYLEDKIDLCIFEDQQILTKKDALNKIKSFFSTSKIQNIDVIHNGVSKDKSSQYKVAKISTAKETLRIFVYSKGELGSKSVKEIRIDKF